MTIRKELKHSTKPHYSGHRKRLRQRFMKHGIESLQDYEVVELLLTFSIPQKDIKPTAKDMLKKFGSVKGIFEASSEELKVFSNVKDKTVELITFIKEISALYQMEKAKESPILKTPKELIDYCIKKIGDKKDEQFRVIYLNSRFSIIDDDVVSKGTIDRATVYPRKVMEMALKKKACVLVFTHNHPDGDPQPSEYDINLTRALNLAAGTLEIMVYDHIIVTPSNYFSFREKKLL